MASEFADRYPHTAQLCQLMSLSACCCSGGSPVYLAEAKKPEADFGGPEVSPLLDSWDDLEIYCKEILEKRSAVEGQLYKIFNPA
ncbi:hypothetical protein [Chromobacterium haemolyticum]|uniref:hypothetical protein n=1 Tax=Chromobacterium haemolyticum TaxID=394935 RepID=UPI002448F436|nr:hypothetical protein [Chromobacterium haemolyticum]MDH0342052.1 hypothetical protein [Chromobacterium haemolyticum]